MFEEKLETFLAKFIYEFVPLNGSLIRISDPCGMRTWNPGSSSTIIVINHGSTIIVIALPAVFGWWWHCWRPISTFSLTQPFEWLCVAGRQIFLFFFWWVMLGKGHCGLYNASTNEERRKRMAKRREIDQVYWSWIWKMASCKIQESQRKARRSISGMF